MQSRLGKPLCVKNPQGKKKNIFVMFQCNLPLAYPEPLEFLCSLETSSNYSPSWHE